MPIEICDFIKERHEFMRTSPESWLLHDILLDTEKDRWPNHMFASRHIRMQHVAYLRKARRRLHSWCRRLFRAEIRTEHCSVRASSIDSDSEDFDCVALTDRIDQRAQVSQPGSSTTTQSWAHGSWSQTNQSWQGHWQYFGWGNLKTCGTRESTTSEGGNLNTRGSFTGDRWTPLVNIMTHSTFL